MTRIRPSKPRLMARVLDAVATLSNTRGSSTHEVLNFIRQGNASLKNLTLQVRRALKHAVNAGLLRHRSGRYKVLATLNPAPTSALLAKEPVNNDQKSEKKKSDLQTRMDDTRSRRAQKRKKISTSRRQVNKRSDNARRKTQRSPHSRRTNGNTRDRERRQQKRAREEEEFENQSSGWYVLHGRDQPSVPFNRKGKRSRVSKQELESSDFSDGSDRKSDVDRKRVSRASTSSRRESKRKEAHARSRDRSTSRARSAQRVQTRQHPTEEVENDRHRCDENHRLTECAAEHQESSEHVGDRQPNEDNGGNNLEDL